MLEKKAYTVQMTLDIPDAEKRIAEKAEESFEILLGKLKLALEHLNMIYVPFKKYNATDTDEIVENRDVLRRYRDQIKLNYEEILSISYACLSLMSDFSIDSSVEELMNSFTSGIKDLEKQVNYLLSIFSNLNSTEFRDSLLASIEAVKKQSSQLKQLINDRVLEHIGTNILAKNWGSFVDDKLQAKMKNKVPLIVELYRERQKALK